MFILEGELSAYNLYYMAANKVKGATNPYDPARKEEVEALWEVYKKALNKVKWDDPNAVETRKTYAEDTLLQACVICNFK